MSGRIRSIKPEILDDEKTASLSHLEWRLFVSIWLIADDYGNLRGDAGYVLGQALWAAGETREAVDRALQMLSRVSLLTRYAVRGQTYYHINGWSKHQKVDKPGKPRMPGVDEAEPEQHPNVDAIREDLANLSRESSETPATDLRPPTSDQDPDRDPEVVAPKELPPTRTSRKKRRCRIPEDWQPHERERQLAIANGIDCDALSRKFKRHYAASGNTYVNWDEKFAGWIENEPQRGIGGHSRPQSTVLQGLLADIADAERRGES